MRLSDLSLTVSQRKLACVLDPALVLGHAQGATLALRLTQVLEPWLTRSFWQVIDASELLAGHRPQAAADGASPGLRPDAAALSAWMALRDETDAGSWSLRWVGDNQAESQVRDAADADVVDRYEHLAAALARRAPDDAGLPAPWHGIDPVAIAMDTLALSACLGGALILSQLTDGVRGEPWPVQALAQAGLHAHPLVPMPTDTLFATERALLRDAFVSAGLAAMSQGLPRLAVVHVIVDASPPSAADDVEAESADPWAGARAWWYVL